MIIKIILIAVGIILLHLLCGLICIIRIFNNPKICTLIDVLLLSAIGPIIILIWVSRYLYYLILAKIHKLNERRRTKKQS
jgi:hypothetical protein